MSHTINAKTNKQQNHPKVNFKKYLSNINEPESNIAFRISPELEAEMLDNRLLMKYRIKKHAQRMREKFFTE